MKSEVAKAPAKFEPLIVKITLESEDELQALKDLFVYRLKCKYPSDARRDEADSLCDRLFQQTYGRLGV